MAYWIKIDYDRRKYLIDLDSITAFSCQPNNRITFWLPNSSEPIILNKQGSEESYSLVLEYIKKKIHITDQVEDNWWVRIIYDRHEWFIDLNCISTFACELNGRITFWLPDSTKDIIINPQSNPESYQKILEFVNKVTGYSLP
ncbi:MAG: hypothetical protein QNJ68_01885 [Microcoleaceae cyanobacterium MO_207.B10]|nr:hypothetical protein [Microcoleaceae cyanobacterium MO_207.B10]